ncbi:GIY-YIG nuclease family protein [Kineococcus sp. SYSU DK002]|uniref:GIY-YIG nuclease family protein n=1 Tax=Kineococcus sp. SYSU DK002 TaxID=3383123 RepID=UPI003D7E4045
MSASLLSPDRLWTRAEVLARPTPVPAANGVYAWYFDTAPSVVPVDGCHQVDGMALLYVGISPKRPPANGGPVSKQTLRSRVRYHYRGNAYGSTLRLTLGVLLADELGIGLRRVGSTGNRLTFSDGEAVLNEWMAAHARVCWVEDPRPWLTETKLIEGVDLPLNLLQNAHGSFYAQLSQARARQRELARSLPVLPR